MKKSTKVPYHLYDDQPDLHNTSKLVVFPSERQTENEPKKSPSLAPITKWVLQKTESTNTSLGPVIPDTWTRWLQQPALSCN